MRGGFCRLSSGHFAGDPWWEGLAKMTNPSLKRRTIVYEPYNRHRIGLIATWILMFRNIVNSRELIFQMYRRDFLNMYRKSFLGLGWLVVSPIVAVASWLIMNATGILAPGDVGIPYPAYVLLSSSFWGLFMNFISAGKATLDAGAGFIMQVKYPHEALLFKQVLQEFTNFSISLLLNLAVLLFYGVHPSWMMLLLPFLVLPLFFLGSGIGLLLALVKIVASDIDRIATVILGLCIYVTPVIYSPQTKNHVLQTIINFNPLTYLIGTIRDVTIYGSFTHLKQFLIATAGALAFFLISWRLYYVSEELVIEKMA
jgi:lipopolysaccharide transport system permease protein